MTPTPSPDPARYVSPVCRDGSHQACANFRGTCRCTCHAAAVEGTERPDTAALLTIGDWLLRTLPGHQGAEQTAAALAYTARWIDAQPPVPPSPAPQADGEVATALRRLEDAVLLDDPNHAVAEAAEVFIRARLAAPSAPAERPQPEPGALVLGTEDRFHLWAKLYEIQQEAGLCRFGGRNYDPQLDHIYEEATTALAYIEPPAPTDGEP